MGFVGAVHAHRHSIYFLRKPIGPATRHIALPKYRKLQSMFNPWRAFMLYFLDIYQGEV
jgi:hypothetical protein